MAHLDTIRKTWGIGGGIYADHFIAGVELEIESIADYVTLPMWKVETDGSLRNEGREFISPPLNRTSLVEDFKEIHATLEHFNEFPKFSERTSIHAHINCLDLTQQQTKSIVLWYALFEPVFFLLVDPARRNNIHCVGLDQTMLSDHYKKSFPLLVSKWSKYTALNLKPLETQGTIEFRHMEGHDDAIRFGNWLQVLESLWEYGKNNILTKHSLSDEAVLKAFDAIFATHPIHSIRGNVKELVSDNLVDIKLAFV
jgi:hypothetical protein